MGPTMTGTLLDFVLPTSRTVEKWSYGDPIMRMPPPGTGSRIPMTVRDKEYVAETLGYAPIGVPAKAAATGVMMTPPIGAIKPKGGNWFTGQVERTLEPLRVRDTQVPYIGQDPAERLRDMETSLAQNIEAGVPVDMNFVQGERDRLASGMAINKWLDTKLTKYIKNEMATPEDPLRALAERGVLHFNPPEINSLQRGQLGITRSALGYPSESTALSDLARKWEDLTDYYVQRSDAGSVVRPNYFLRPEDAQRVYAENPWLFKVPPETSVYSLNRGLSSGDTGFRHLVDELRAATDPNTELPANLRLSVDKLDKVTVPQAVELVSKINAWRAEQAAAAEKAGMLANLQTGARLQDDSLQLSFVDKPGGKWIDLPEATEGKNVDFCTTIGKQGGWCTMNKATAKSYGSGNNRLVALVDAEGRPHLQAMISRGISSDPRGDIELIQSVLTEAEFRKLNRFMESDDFTGETQDAVDWMAQNMPRAYAKYQKQLQNEPLNITELKPPENSFSSKRAKEYASRDPEYQDKITDAALNFLNNGQWGDVKDLGIYNIVDIQNPDSVIDELRKIYKLDYRALPKTDSFYAAVDADPYAPRFMKRSDFEKFIQPFESVNPEPKSHGGAVGMAAGGAVMMDEGGPVEYDPDKINALAKLIESEDFVLEPDERFTAALTRGQIKPEDLQLREGVFSVRPVRGGEGYSARLAADVAPGTQAFADVNPFRRLVEQYGLQYARPLPGGAAAAELRYDPITQAKTLSGVFRQMLDKDSEISARGSYTQAGERPSYGAHFEYKKRFATGGAVMMEEGGPVEYDPKKVDQIADSFFKKFISLDTPQNMTAAETAADIAAGFVPGLGTAQAARDLERARREGDKLGMALSAVGMVPVVGGMAKAGSKIDDLLRKYLRESLSKSPATASREVEMRSIQEALEKTNRKAAEAAEARKTDILSSPESFKSTEWPGTFYRGIRQATSGPSGEPLSQVSSLIMPQRGVNVLATQPNNPRRTAWAASNPLTASSFASDPNSLVVPLQLTEKPSVVFNAEGAPWWRFFSQTGDLNRGSYNYPLRSEFKDMLRDPEVKTILVKDIMDTGIDETKNNLRLLSELYGVNLKPENFLSDNLLIKDPSAVRYLLTQETPKITESVKVKKAQGGAVSANYYDEGKIQALADSILEELHG